jgi:hypothetical protein
MELDLHLEIAVLQLLDVAEGRRSAFAESLIGSRKNGAARVGMVLEEALELLHGRALLASRTCFDELIQGTVLVDVRSFAARRRPWAKGVLLGGRLGFGWLGRRGRRR